MSTKTFIGENYIKFAADCWKGDPINMEAAHSFRYRLREAAKQALTLGDTLLQMSQDASVPDASQLEELRNMEASLDVAVRYRLRDIKGKEKCASTG